MSRQTDLGDNQAVHILWLFFFHMFMCFQYRQKETSLQKNIYLPIAYNRYITSSANLVYRIIRTNKSELQSSKQRVVHTPGGSW